MPVPVLFILGSVYKQVAIAAYSVYYLAYRMRNRYSLVR